MLEVETGENYIHSISNKNSDFWYYQTANTNKNNNSTSETGV